MSEDLLDLSSRIIDHGLVDVQVNRVTNRLSEVAPDLAVVESFSHCVAFDTGDGMSLFDTSGVHTGAAVADAVRAWRDTPVRDVVYTHGHADHVGGSGFFAHHRPRVIGHRNVEARLQRYALTNRWNLIINARQFGGVPGELNLSIGSAGGGVQVAPSEQRGFLPGDVLHPTESFEQTATIELGGTRVDLHHARGETDDHLWAWFPDRRWIMAGDFLIWNFPNAGNPQKVQRYPAEWAAALRRMIAAGPDLLVPAHGLPIAGRDRITRVLGDVATVLERLVADVIEAMNAGATLDDVVHGVRPDPAELAKPYLRPFYDEPEFVVRNIWRQYGGWWDGAPSRLKPSPDTHLAAAVAELVGGAVRLIERAEQAVADDDLRLAGHFADLAAWAAPDDPGIHRRRAAVYLHRHRAEIGLMTKGIFASAARQSELTAQTLESGPLEAGAQPSGHGEA